MTKELIYKKYEIKYPDLIFTYEYDDSVFQARVTIKNISERKVQEKKGDVLDNIAFHLGIAIIPFAYSLENFNKIVIEPFALSAEQMDFFANYFKLGLAEFRHTNNFKINEGISFESRSGIKRLEASSEELLKKAVVLNGAGKDSAVAGEIMKEMEIPFSWFTMNLTEAKLGKIKVSGNHDQYGISKINFDRKYETLKKYKGHKPLSAFITFAGLLNAYLLDAKYLVAGNEYSSNFGNMVIDGVDVNHQYTKSFEFEMLINDYIKKNILEKMEYFSLLRPLYEIQIGKLFALYPEYFSSIISCNIGQNKGFWCKECAKCAFVFLILYPFIKDEEVITIFGEDLFDNEKIRVFVKPLCGIGDKPFECVGTDDESKLALALCIEKNPNLINKSYANDLLECLEGFEIENSKQKILFDFSREENFPQELKKDIEAYLEKSFKLS